MAARELWAALNLLDRQLVDREGAMCGMVDDLELERSEPDGTLLVTAILSGPGTLASRLGAPRLGAWLRRAISAADPNADDPVRIPFRRVTDIGSHISLSLDAADTATAASERWVREHVIGHIPGSRRAPE